MKQGGTWAAGWSFANGLLWGRVRPLMWVVFGASLWAVRGETPNLPPKTPAARTGSGFIYRNEQVPEAPWSIQIARMNRHRTNLAILTTLGRNKMIGTATVTDQMRRWPRELGRPLAAINGDYFVRHGTYEGDPEGIHISGGEIYSAANGKSAFWIDAEGGYHLSAITSNFKVTLPNGETFPIGLNEESDGENLVLYTSGMGSSTRTFRTTELILESETGSTQPWPPFRPSETYLGRISEIRTAGNSLIAPGTAVLAIPRSVARRVNPERGGRVVIHLATTPELRGVQTAMSGGPALLHDGKRTDFRSEPVRHPRTAIGWNKEDFYFVQVDGRNPGVSVGMTLTELADYLQKLGCQEALNLDGGGSSTLWASGQVMNTPSEGAERQTGNALVMVMTGVESRGVRAGSTSTNNKNAPEVGK